jgi:hypothetical protein
MPSKAVGATAAVAPPPKVASLSKPAAAKAATKAGKPPRPQKKPTASKTPTKAAAPPVAKKRKQPSLNTNSEEKKKVKGTTSAGNGKKAKTDKNAKSDSKQSTSAIKGFSKEKETPVDPYNQILAGSRLPPVPVIMLARREDVTPNFKKSFPLAPRKSRAKPRPSSATLSAPLGRTTDPSTATTTAMVSGSVGMATNGLATATGDARVALRVIPGGQIPSRLKRPNDTAAEGAGTGKKLKTKSKTGRPPSAADSSGVTAVGNHRGAKLSYEWHPGMYSINGITLVEPNCTSPVPPPPPPLVQDSTPPRYRPMRITASDLPEFDQEDGARASVQYLRYIALCIGRSTSNLPGRLQYTFNSEQRVYRERLTRILLARDGRHADKVPAGGTRRSTRTRFAPDVFIPTTAEGGRNSAFGYRREGDPGLYSEYGEVGAGGVMIQPFNPTELTDVRLGPMYQTELPQQRRRPSVPEKIESRWTENLILEAGKKVVVGKTKTGKRPETCLGEGHTRSGCEDERHAEAIALSISQLATTVGPLVSEAFGLGTMGTDTAKNLTEEQQYQLYEGFKKHGRDFFKISRDFVSGDVAPRVLAAYYYDVWKLSAIPAAKRWFADKAAEEEQRIAEEKQQEILRAEEAARRAKSMEASNRRRQVKEAFHWVRNAAKNPHAASFNKIIVRERANRVIMIHKMIAEAAFSGSAGAGDAAAVAI